MTAPGEVTVLDAPVRPAPPPPPARRARAPRALWVVALAVLLPVAVPLAAMFARLLADAGDAAGVLWSGRTARLLGQTLALTAAVSATAAAVGVATAWITTRTDLPARRVWSTLAALPLVLPSYVIALTLISAFGAGGLLADAAGLGALPAASGAVGAWLALTIATYPYVHLIVAAALRKLDPAHEEAARSLGATRWRAFRTVVLPQLRPAVAAASLLVSLYTLSDFGAVSLMRFDAFTRVIYAQYQGRLDRTPAAVLAAVLIIVAGAVLWAEARTRGRASYYSPRPARPARLVSLSRPARAGALGFLGAVVTVALVLPLGTLVAWVVRGARRGDAPVIPWDAAWGSVWVSAAAAAVALVAAVPIAVLVVRYRSRASVILDRSVYGVFALPHITVALAMVFFAVAYLGPLYQGFAVLIVTYAALFMPQASGAARAALEQVNPHLEEAARGLGRGPLRTIAEVTVPLIGRGLLAGGALVFLTTMKELPATLLLRPTGFDTLAVDIWQAASEGFFARAAAPALLLVAASAVPLYLVMGRRHAA